MSSPKHPNRRRVNRLRPEINLQRQRLHELLINAPSAHDTAEVMRTLHLLLYPAARHASATKARQRLSPRPSPASRETSLR